MNAVHELLENVRDEKSFLVFVKALIADREPQEGKPIDEFGFTDDWRIQILENAKNLN